MERTPNESQHTKLTLVKKILPLLLPGFKLATFWITSPALYQQAIPAVLISGRLKSTATDHGYQRALSSHLHVLEFEVTAHSSTTNH